MKKCLICKKLHLPVASSLKNMPHVPNIDSKNCFVTYLKEERFINMHTELEKLKVHTNWLGSNNKYFRSKFEIGFANWLKANRIRFQYEPVRIKVREGLWYTPDFRIIGSDIIVEVKGTWENNAYTKFTLFKKLYPFPVLLVDRAFMRVIGCKPMEDYVG